MATDHRKPDFLDRTFLELGDGLHFSLPVPASVTDSRHLESSNPWDVLACALARAQSGVFDAIPVLLDLMQAHDRASVWHACAQLIGFAGSHRLQREMAERFANRFHERGVQLYVSAALVNGCGLWSIPYLRAMHRVAVDEETSIYLEICMSHLLEPGPGAVWYGPAKTFVVDESLPPPFSETTVELDRQGYEALIDERLAAMRPLTAFGGLAVVGGERFWLKAVTRKMLARIGNGEGSEVIEWERMVLEATTGLPCGGFFDAEWQLRPLAAAAVIEDFLDSGDADKYEPGVRYFFGHRVPGDAAAAP